MTNTPHHSDIPYIPTTAGDREQMLEAIGVERIEELFEQVPEGSKLKRELQLPDGLDEAGLMRLFSEIASRNRNTDDLVCFLGGGIYDHHIPAVVRHLASREEFYTSYTPYQAEASQGMLQAIYEYQTYICRLTGMDVSNASIYDGATALAEAAVMIYGATGKKRIVAPQTVNPAYREVLKTYGSGLDLEIVETGYSEGVADIDELQERVGEGAACVIVQQPNFFGNIEPVQAISGVARDAGAAFIVCIDPVSLGILAPPADYGADVVVGEGQSLGNAMSFGGPLLGIFAAKAEYLRRMPGRLVGATTDTQGRRCYTLTLQTREQHIRREQATSNICTNQSLNAVAAAIYLSAVGKRGLAQVADLCLQKAHYAAKRISELPGYEMAWPSSFFKEFVIRCPQPPTEINKRLLDHGILGGLHVGKYYPELSDCMLIAVTEKRTKEEIDLLVEELAACT